MRINLALCRVVIALSVAAVAAIGQTSNPPTSVKIGKLTWTKQNINIETPDSWCYDNDPANCERYGRLYTWAAAVKACASMGGKWRLPEYDDWENLIKSAGGQGAAGKKLKSKTGWEGGGGGTDSFGFSALGGGSRYDTDGGFYSAGYHGYWWSSAYGRVGGARRVGIDYDGDHVYEGIYYNNLVGFSARCVASD